LDEEERREDGGGGWEERWTRDWGRLSRTEEQYQNECAVVDVGAGSLQTAAGRAYFMSRCRSTVAIVPPQSVALSRHPGRRPTEFRETEYSAERQAVYSAARFQIDSSSDIEQSSRELEHAIRVLLNERPLPQRILEILNSANPLLKLSGLVWGAIASMLAVVGLVLGIVGAVHTYRRDREEDRRRGFFYEPAIDITMADHNCTLTNSGARAIDEATISFLFHTVNGKTHYTAAAAKDRLSPRQDLAAPFSMGDVLEECQNGSRGGFCRPGDNCRFIVECEARYHREADLEPFTSSAYAIATAGCSKFLAFNFYSDEELGAPFDARTTPGGDPATRKAFECLASGHEKVDRMRGVAKRYEEGLDPFAEKR
jgi:hypothetical protein